MWLLLLSGPELRTHGGYGEETREVEQQQLATGRTKLDGTCVQQRNCGLSSPQSLQPRFHGNSREATVLLRSHTGG